MIRWVRDFSIPTTNNLSERAIRNLKSKQNASGQFKNIKSAENFAIIKSFTETSRKNGINEFKALRRLMAGNPYTVREILSFQPDTGWHSTFEFLIYIEQMYWLIRYISSESIEEKVLDIDQLSISKRGYCILNVCVPTHDSTY